jgi:hypothetical protein
MLRNIWCPEYSRCLTEACIKNIPFTCENCSHRDNAQGKPDAWDIHGDAQRCLILIIVALDDRVFKQWQELKKGKKNGNRVLEN